jgi:hypothetical protein
MILNSKKEIFSISNKNIKENCCGNRNIWINVKNRMFQTQAKFHYTFKLRDLSRIVQGIIQVTPKKLILLIWLFQFGLMNVTEFSQINLFQKKIRILLVNIIRNIGKEHFGDAFDGLLEESSDTFSVHL